MNQLFWLNKQPSASLMAHVKSNVGIAIPYRLELPWSLWKFNEVWHELGTSVMTFPLLRRGKYELNIGAGSYICDSYWCFLA